MNQVLRYYTQVWIKVWDGQSPAAQPRTWIREHREYVPTYDSQEYIAQVYSNIIQVFNREDPNPRLIYIIIR